MSPTSNSDWLDALNGADAARKQAASTELREMFHRALARGFGRQLSDSDRDDLVQDSLLKVHTKLNSFAGNSKFTTWATTIAVHTALDEVRRRKYKHIELADAARSGELSLLPTGETNVARQQRDAVLRDAIDTALTPKQREALLAELGGLPLMEVARRMNTSRGALYKLLHDARKRLFAHFERRGVTAAELLVDTEETR